MLKKIKEPSSQKTHPSLMNLRQFIFLTKPVVKLVIDYIILHTYNILIGYESF